MNAGSGQAAGDVRIVPFRPDRAAEFRRLNLQWLERHFTVEPLDRELLDDPVGKVLDPGGEILFAAAGDAIVGTCALLHAGDGAFELSKMSVEEDRRGQGIGRLLIEAALDAFRRRDGRELFLESSSRLQPALRLYESVGFMLQPQLRPGSHYRRADVYMIWKDPASR